MTIVRQSLFVGSREFLVGRFPECVVKKSAEAPRRGLSHHPHADILEIILFQEGHAVLGSSLGIIINIVAQQVDWSEDSLEDQGETNLSDRVAVGFPCALVNLFPHDGWEGEKHRH